MKSFSLLKQRWEVALSHHNLDELLQQKLATVFKDPSEEGVAGIFYLLNSIDETGLCEVLIQKGQYLHVRENLGIKHVLLWEKKIFPKS